VSKCSPVHAHNLEQRPKFQRRGETLGSPYSDFQLSPAITPMFQAPASRARRTYRSPLPDQPGADGAAVAVVVTPLAVCPTRLRGGAGVNRSRHSAAKVQSRARSRNAFRSSFVSASAAHSMHWWANCRYSRDVVMAIPLRTPKSPGSSKLTFHVWPRLFRKELVSG
jgi:hypothetical protein